MRIKKWSCLANKEKDLMHWWSFIVWPRRSYIWNQSSRQDRDRSTSEDFDLEKLGRCAKVFVSTPLCWRNGSSLTPLKWKSRCFRPDATLKRGATRSGFRTTGENDIHGKWRTTSKSKGGEEGGTLKVKEEVRYRYNFNDKNIYLANHWVWRFLYSLQICIFLQVMIYSK